MEPPAGRTPDIYDEPRAALSGHPRPCVRGLGEPVNEDRVPGHQLPSQADRNACFPNPGHEITGCPFARKHWLADDLSPGRQRGRTNPAKVPGHPIQFAPPASRLKEATTKHPPE